MTCATPATVATDEMWQIINQAQTAALNLEHLLRVADDYLGDAFPVPMPAGCTEPFEATMSLIAGARLITEKLREHLEHAEITERDERVPATAGREAPPDPRGPAAARPDGG
jgi:hypothetical protein